MALLANLVLRNRVIYNFPPVTAGIDLESDDVAEIAKLAPNVCGIMLSYVSIYIYVGAIHNMTTDVAMLASWQESLLYLMVLLLQRWLG